MLRVWSKSVKRSAPLSRQAIYVSSAAFSENTPKKSSWLPKWMLKDNIVASPTFNRFNIVPASLAIHMSLGSVYAWSIFNSPLTRESGVITAASSDWALGDVVPIFSTSIVCLGLSAAIAGKWLEEVGPRAVGLVSAASWGGGLLLGSLGIMTHNLPLLYLGYGVFGTLLNLSYNLSLSSLSA